MGRRKVNIQWIADDSARRTTFRRRRAGLLKKISELSTLCDVPACVVVYGPGETQPEVWPSVPEATNILQNVKDLPDSNNCKKVLDREGLLRQNVAKATEKLRKRERDNREREINIIIQDFVGGHRKSLDGLSPEMARDLQWVVDRRLQAVSNRIEELRSETAPAPPPQQDAPLIALDTMPSPTNVNFKMP